MRVNAVREILSAFYELVLYNSSQPICIKKKKKKKEEKNKFVDISLIMLLNP